MSTRPSNWRRLGFWLGPWLLLGSLLLGGGLLLAAGIVWPLAFPLLLLLVVPAGGLLLGAVLIGRATQPRWAKLLALLSSVLVPGLLLLSWLALLPDGPTRDERERLLFYLPAGFRGEVNLVHDANTGQPLPRINDQVLLLVPPNGLFTTSDTLHENWLAEADYYFVNTGLRRLSQLPLLREADFALLTGWWTLWSIGKRRTVGVFAAQGIQYNRFGSATYYPDLPSDTRPPSVAYLTCTVACYDSLAGLRRRPPR